MEIGEIKDHVLLAAIGICDNKRKSNRNIVGMIEEEKPIDEHRQQTVNILKAKAKRHDKAIQAMEDMLK